MSKVIFPSVDERSSNYNKIIKQNFLQLYSLAIHEKKSLPNNIHNLFTKLQQRNIYNSSSSSNNNNNNNNNKNNNNNNNNNSNNNEDISYSEVEDSVIELKKMLYR